MSERGVFAKQPQDDLSRAVRESRKRMIAASARPIAVKWRAMKRGDRFRSIVRDAAGQIPRAPD